MKEINEFLLKLFTAFLRKAFGFSFWFIKDICLQLLKKKKLTNSAFSVLRAKVSRIRKVLISF